MSKDDRVRQGLPCSLCAGKGWMQGVYGLTLRLVRCERCNPQAEVESKQEVSA